MNKPAQGYGTDSINISEVVKLTDMEAAARAGDTTALLQMIEKHLSKLAERHAAERKIQPTIVQIPANQTLKVDFSTVPHNTIIFAAVVNAVGVLFGDYSGIPATVTPHLPVTVGLPLVIPTPLQGQTYTLLNNNATAATFVIIPMAI